MKSKVLKKIVWPAVMLLCSCSDNNILVSSDKFYFPLHVNLYWDYSVNETDILQTTTCADGGQSEKNYQLRLVVEDSVKNGEGGLTYIIHRYTRTDSSLPWDDLDTWSIRITTGAIIQSEGNIPYVKFVFPLHEGMKWDGNLYNDQSAENYLAASVGKPFSVSATSYPKTISVYESDYDDFFISRDQRSEVYAFNVGLVYKKTDQRTFFQDPCYGEQKIQKGFIYEQSLIGYGKL